MGIRAMRLNAKMSQAELAQRAGISLLTLKKWERGLECASCTALEKISTLLEVNYKELEQGQRLVENAATPGEGYTTAVSDRGIKISRQEQPPEGKQYVVDFYCGAGGLSYGFEMTDQFVTVCGIDLLKDRVQTFTANHKYANGLVGDIRDFDVTELTGGFREVDVVLGGPPCQGFSSIRPFRNLTEGDPRNSLAEHFVLLISKIKPRWFIFENVVGILTHERGNKLRALINGFREAGYLCEWRVLNSALFGIPQNRERVVIIGNRDCIPISWPIPTHLYEFKSMAGARPEVIRPLPPLFSQSLPRSVSLIEAISDLPNVASGEEKKDYTCAPKNGYQLLMREGDPNLCLHRSTKHSAKMLNIIRHAGSNIYALPAGMVKSGFSSCYSRLDADKPSTTITVNFVHPASNRCIHPFQDRALTPREGARIQSFPDKFFFAGTTAQIVKQIGNAVPPLLGKTIANSVIESELLLGAQAA
jgi:DNA (cytosine-5)-methyltransferase 1